MLDAQQTLTRPRTLLVGRSFVKRSDGKLLIIRRSPHDSFNAGKWEVPGGKVDRGQNVADAQRREVREETGLLVQTVQPYVCAVSYMIDGGYHDGWRYRAEFSVTRLVEDGKVLRISHEHTAHAWVSYEQMLAYDLTNEVRKAARVAKRYLVSAKN